MTVAEVIAVRSHTRAPNNSAAKKQATDTSYSQPAKALPFNKPTKKSEPFNKAKPKDLS
jgi:hypothetical protein